jgi:hypothetical protein
MIGKDRLCRNYERTWLYVFIVDKNFGLMTGRPMSVSRKEVPAGVSQWWQCDAAAPLDRVICGIVEMRLLVVRLSVFSFFETCGG